MATSRIRELIKKHNLYVYEGMYYEEYLEVALEAMLCELEGRPVVPDLAPLELSGEIKIKPGEVT